MKKFKKAVIIVLVLLILAGAAAGGVYAYQKYQKENMQAEVQYVSDLNWGFSGDSMNSSGFVTNDYVQNVYTEDKIVTEVKVAEGDQVEIGDPLLIYDTTDIQLQIDMKKLEIQGIDNDITLAKRELEKLKNITPVPDSAKNDTEDTDAADEDSDSTDNTNNATVVVMQVEQKDGDAYNYIDKSARPYTGKGTVEEPYRFLCTPECYVLGSYLNQLVKKEQVAAFEIWSGNSVDEGTLISCWTVDGADMTAVDDDAKWSVSTHELIEDEIIEEEEEEEPESEEEESVEEVYTVTELKKEIADKENDLKDLDIDKRSADLSLQKLQKTLDNNTVTAAINGVVKTVGDPQNPPSDGSAFIEIVGSEGLYVKGEVSELMLDQIKVGQSITANSWNNGQTYSATITEISEYPVENSGGYYGEGNPNVSYYSFTAYIEDSTGLNNGDYIDLSMTPVSSEEEADSLYIEKAYVRTEDGKAYVLKAGEDGRLVKQYVQTGKTLYGSAIEIKAGLSMEDQIAFPYGKTAKEGIRAVDSEEIE